MVVINDGSTDRTDEVMRALVAEHQASGHPARLVYERKPNGGKASAMNRALELASGELVITTDADSVMAPDALTHFARQFEDPTVMSVSGNVKIGNAVGIIGLVQQLEYMYGFWFKKADALMGSMYIVGGAAAAYRRRVFDTLPRTKDRTVFDERNITEDIEMSTRIQDAGHRISYAPDAVIHTEGPTEWKAFARQRLRWKYGRFLTFLQYRHLFFSTRRPQKAWLTMLVLPVALLWSSSCSWNRWRSA
ncbi:glycosyltransferase family 2 protein [Aestuariimicrobium sp. p3-SID1156]|nr:glycosyltransferase family 2 protein [Aestuariimicrobium sp. p3-SID1156]